MDDVMMHPTSDASPEQMRGDESLQRVGQEVLHGSVEPSFTATQGADGSGIYFSEEEVADLHTRREFIHALRSRKIDVAKLKKACRLRQACARIPAPAA